LFSFSVNSEDGFDPVSEADEDGLVSDGGDPEELLERTRAEGQSYQASGATDATASVPR
jgi:hypothetical protein